MFFIHELSLANLRIYFWQFAAYISFMVSGLFIFFHVYKWLCPGKNNHFIKQYQNADLLVNSTTGSKDSSVRKVELHARQDRLQSVAHGPLVKWLL